jgi:hypothetical protein
MILRPVDDTGDFLPVLAYFSGLHLVYLVRCGLIVP